MDYLLRFNTCVLLAVCHVMRFCKWCCCFCRRPKRVSSVTDPLLNQSATLLAERIRRKEVCHTCKSLPALSPVLKVTSESVVRAYINRIMDVNGIINAVAEPRFEEALREAQEADALLADPTTDVDEIKRTRPLLGIPVTIKENLQMKGLSATMCCKPYANAKAEDCGEAVRRLRDAGAVVLLVSTTPEYCLAIETFSKLYGRTRNPYNSLRSVGGSSGGEGALLGAGASLIGLGSDLAGSIRFPSAFNGVFGHKPTHGLIPTEGHMPPLDDPLFRKHTVVGPMARYAEDIPLMMRVIGDHADLRLDQPVELCQLKIYYMTDCGMNFGMLSVSGEIKRAVRETAELLSDHCKAELVEKKFDNLGLSMEICSALLARIQFVAPLQTPDRNYGLLSELFLNIFGMAHFSGYTLMHVILDNIVKASTSAAKIVKYDAALDELRREMSDELKDCGVFIYPVFPSTALRAGEFGFGYGGIFYSFVINILGFPSITVPVGFDSNGLPIAVQIIANINQDRLCFAVANELQKLYGGWKSP